MYAIIKKFFLSFFSNRSVSKEDIELNTELSNTGPTDITISISANVDTESVFCKIDTNVEDILSNSSSISKCEKIAYVLSVICENNKYMIDLLSHNMQEQKQISDKHLLFYDNIIFFWKQYLSLKKNISSYNNDPLIKPSRAFKTYVMEEKI